jgi:hypothetical protein
MLIGVDFDNTIVSYDALFHRLALEQGLIPAEVPASKEQVRNYLRRCGQEEAWTELQGYVYGARLCDAAAFPGAIEFFRKCREQDVPVCIVSHKTRHPFRGPAYDLHQAALDWLVQNAFFNPTDIGLPRDAVHLETTLAGKLQRIADLGCTHFIDDLPELLSEAAFPDEAQPWLFDPNNHHPTEQRFARVTSWLELDELLLCGARSRT